ncbi:MAG: hypothetical protein ACYDA0_13920 [Candidatus Dormibacteraceae bacterium]
MALVLAATLALIGGGALAVSYLTRPAEVHGKPVSGTAGGSFAAKMGWPGHPIQTSVADASRLGGFHVLTLSGLGNAQLNSITYIPKVVPADQPAPATGGSVSLDYSIDGIEVQINEGLDPNTSAPLQINQKIAPGYTGPLCTSVETIDGGQYVFMRCPDGVTISDVIWKTLDGVDVSLVKVIPTVVGPKSNPPAGLSIDLIRSVIEHLQ